MNLRQRSARQAPVFLFTCVLTFASTTVPVLTDAQTVPQAEIDGHVVDAQTGLPLSGATISLDAHTAATTTDERGDFRLNALSPGLYALRVARVGYQPADSDQLVLTAGTTAHVALSLQTAATASRLTTIGRTSTTVGGALQQASTIYRSLDAQLLLETGTTRAGDALRGLPALNNGITGDTAALSDDLQLSLRGIGTLETLATVDGHPIAYGVPGGYNYQLSPITGLRNINVTYGSGSNLFGYSAIGGTVDFQTLEPSVDRQVSVAQGYGQYSRASTQLQVTGTINRLGYAVAYGAASLDGPLKNDTMYQPGAAFDQSAVIPGANADVRNLGIYKDDSTAVSHSGLAKIRYALSPMSSLTFTSLLSSYWVDKTGNGDADYTPYAQALAQGQSALSGYSPANFAQYPSLPACPAGTFVATNANGQPNGYGPPSKGSPPFTLGARDGGITCQTPQQYAAFNTGYAGAGTAWQAFTFGDYHLGFRSTPRNQIIRADAFSDRYLNTISRADALPFNTAPGDSNGAFLYRNGVSEGGASVSDTVAGRNNDAGLGFSYLNTTYANTFTTPGGSSGGAPIVHESGFLFHDIYHPEGSRLTAYIDGNLKRSTATNTSYFDPRASLVYSASARDVVRLAEGATTTQPSGDELDQPFIESPPGGAGGGVPINCSSNSIGNAPSSVLKPERGVDTEFAYGHRLNGDSLIQLTLYNVNIYDKLFQTTLPASQTGTGFIDPAYLAQTIAAIGKQCPNPASTLAITGTFNLGQERARGAMLGGRQRIAPRSFIDYDWTLDSTALISVPLQVLQGNVTLVPGSQLAHLPLHTFVGAFDQVFGRAIDVRYTLHAFSAGNTKALPAYNYSDLRASVPAGSGLVSVTLSNVFNQWGSIQGLRGAGVPLALNRYATAANYAPYIGNTSSEQFGLPYRSIFFNYALFTH